MDFVDFNLSKKLKEKGFREECFARYNCSDKSYFCINSYHPNTESIFYCYNNDEDLGRFYIDAPTISQVLKWLREKKNIYCLPWFEQGIDMWFYAICKPISGCDFPEFMSESDYNTYEQAAIAGIEYVLDNLI